MGLCGISVCVCVFQGCVWCLAFALGSLEQPTNSLIPSFLSSSLDFLPQQRSDVKGCCILTTCVSAPATPPIPTHHGALVHPCQRESHNDPLSHQPTTPHHTHTHTHTPTSTQLPPPRINCGLFNQNINHKTQRPKSTPLSLYPRSTVRWEQCSTHTHTHTSFWFCCAHIVRHVTTQRRRCQSCSGSTARLKVSGGSGAMIQLRLCGSRT
jgi:hypothetical protein